MAKQTTFQAAKSLAEDFWTRNDSSWPESASELAEFVTQHPSLQKPLSLFHYQFQKPERVLEALTHTSFVHEKQDLSLFSYERLEFLGDSVLGLLVSTHLMQKFPELTEGEMSRFRSALVNEHSLAELASFLDLQSCLLMGRGELKEAIVRQSLKDTLLADVFEAFLGAIYLDSDYEQVEKSFHELLRNFRDSTGQEFAHRGKLDDFDAKTRLQELSMSRFRVLPEYHAIELDDQRFRVELWIKGVQLLSETNISKKKAERSLAKQAVRHNLLDRVENSNVW